MILLIDHEDSFTQNLSGALAVLGEDIGILDAKAATLSKVERFDPSAIILSSGPGSPEDWPESVRIVREFGAEIPILGITLGQLIIAAAYGGGKRLRPQIRHGKPSMIRHRRGGLFAYLPEVGHKYSLSEKNNPKHYQEMVSSRPVWRELHEWIKSRDFIRGVVEALRERHIDLGYKKLPTPGRRLTKFAKSLLHGRLDPGKPPLSARFEFSMLPAAGGSVIPHTDSPGKMITLVVSMVVSFFLTDWIIWAMTEPIRVVAEQRGDTEAVKLMYSTITGPFDMRLRIGERLHARQQARRCSGEGCAPRVAVRQEDV